MGVGFWDHDDVVILSASDTSDSSGSGSSSGDGVLGMDVVFEASPNSKSTGRMAG